MSKRLAMRSKRWLGSGLALTLAVTLAVTRLSAADAGDAAGQGSAVAVPALQQPRHHNGSSLDDRVKILAKALDLDVKQQSELRNLLEAQREQVMRVWNDTSLPAANRISATRAIGDKTAEQIRALLNEEQRKKYNPPAQRRDPAPDSSSRTVEDWMQATGPN
ncbi:MAG: hypothetical protein ACRETU_07445 [Steroidobacterales bacterium]